MAIVEKTSLPATRLLVDGIEELVGTYRKKPVPQQVPAWVLPELSCEFLQDVADLLGSSSYAFEFGSGRSTHALRAKFRGVTSVEDSAAWLQKTESLASGISARAEDRPSVAPLRRCWNRLRLIESFPIEHQAETLQRLRCASLILVDSPPNPAKREHALYLALQHAPAGAVIVLDDLEVSATCRFARRLAEQNNKLFHFWQLPIDHQLGIYLKIGSGRLHSRPSMREFVGTWLRA